MTLLLKGTPVMFVSVYLTCDTGIAGVNLQKLSEIGSYVTNVGIPFVIAGIAMCCPPNCWNQAGLPVSRERFCSRVIWKSRAPSGRLIDCAVFATDPL